VNDSSKLMNNRIAVQRTHESDERRGRRSIVLAGEDFHHGGTGRKTTYVAVSAVLLFWVVHYCAFELYQLVTGPDDIRPPVIFLPRLITSLVGIILSVAMVMGQATMRGSSLAARAIAALILTAATAAASAGIAFVVEPPFGVVLPLEWPTVVGALYTRIWIFGAVSAIVLAVFYADDIRHHEQRIAALQALADSAQLRALRNQLNPHFLFNALNSIAGLIAGGQNADAERMTEDVADFLRVSIAMDTQMLITLGDELRLQDLYLEIEKVRFPDRLVVHGDVPDQLRTLLVPALITQPLVENSIKYAVARSTDLVRLSISARRTDRGVEIVIEDDGGNAVEALPKGARLGLSNVANRLHAHYGSSASFDASTTETGGFRNVILIPESLS
jgi:two-component system LytT family sensor kinase